MASHEQDVAADLSRLIAEGHVSKPALIAITRIEPGKLEAFLAHNSTSSTTLTGDRQPLSLEESTRVSVLAAQLVHGMEVDDDERLRAIMESLTSDCELTLQNISRLTGVPIDHVEVAVNDPGTLPSETKYVLALRASYLVNAATQARPR